MITDEAHTQMVETVGRPHQLRMRSSLYPIAGVVTARYADMDPNSHLNNVALESMHEHARGILTEQVFPGTHTANGPRIRIVNSQSIVHFLAEARWPCVIDTRIGVSRIGRTSFVLSSALFHGDTCISLCDSVMVAVDDRPVPLSEDTRGRLAQLLLRSEEANVAQQ
jgi:acyl-CoA thioester hydrolase